MKPVPLDDRLPGLYEPENIRSWRLMKAAIFALIGVAALVYVINDQSGVARQRALMDRGASARARITHVESGRGGESLWMSYSFSVDGRLIEAPRRRVGSFEGLQPGDFATVHYDPADPHRCVIPNELTHARFGWSPWLFAGLLVVMMGLSAVQAWKAIKPERDVEPGE